ncbi:MAG: amino acid adenylation domain-containing protein [Cyanobacteria bacterium P01_H01_bin.21]
MNDFLERIQSLSPKRLALLAYELQSQLESIEQARTEAIAIVGVGCRFPGGVNDPEAYWQLLSSGQNPITEVPPDRWDVDAYYDPDPSAPGKAYTRHGGFLTNVDQFDPDFFGISPREAIHMDPQQRLLLEVSWEALERSGHAPKSLIGSRTGVYVAIGTTDYVTLQTRTGNLGGIDAYSGSGNGFAFASGRISYALGLQGPNMALDGTCASSLMAVHLACQGLRGRECNLALVGGVNLLLSPGVNISYSKTRILAADGRCKTFDAAADGYVRSEGCAAFVLKRLSDAVADRDPILALIRGSAMNHGGASGGLTIPNGLSQQATIRDALGQAKVKPQQIQYVEAQGTGTPLGDTIEVRALGQVFKEERLSDFPLLLGSVKTNIGHTETASGLASLLKVTLALQHGQLPPHLHLQTLNPEINLDQIPAQIPTQLTPWPMSSGPRLAGINSFGTSGANAHAVLEEAPVFPETQPARKLPVSLLPLSAKTPAALVELVQRYAQFLQENPKVELADLCFTAGVGRSHFQHRCLFTATSIPQLQQALNDYLHANDTLNSAANNEPDAPPSNVIGFFPDITEDLGNCGQLLMQTQQKFRAAVEHCNQVLTEKLQVAAIDIAAADGVNTSLLNVVVQYALTELWQSWGLHPSAWMGTGQGRLMAAYQAGYLSLIQLLEWTVKAVPITSLQSPTGLLHDEFNQPIPSDLVLEWLQPKQPSKLVIPPQGPEQILIVGNIEPSWGTSKHWIPAVDPVQPSTLLLSLGELYQRGFAIDWAGFYDDTNHRRIPLPTYPFQRQRYWNDLAEKAAPLHHPATAAVLDSDLTLAGLLALHPEQQQARLEQDLTARFAQAIGVDRDRSSDTEPLTAMTPISTLALDSIMAIELKFDLEKCLGCAVPLAQFLTSHTIADLAAQILASLTSSTVPATLPTVTLAPAERHQPFPLNDIQTAYWVGRGKTFEMGNVAAHIYSEVEGHGLDCERLQQAFNRVIERHPALRTVLLPDGQQQVLDDLPPYEIHPLDWQALSSAEQQQQLSDLRNRLSHQMLDPYTWPLFECCLVRLDEQTVRIFLSIDSLLVDGTSLGIIEQEWGLFYQDLDSQLPPLELSFRDYVLAIKAFEETAGYAIAKTYWQERIPQLPPAPNLPLAIAPSQLTQPRFVRRAARLDSQQWQLLKQQATHMGLTPSALLLAVYAEVLATWSRSKTFCINLTTFNRLPIHPQVQNLVGDFTSLTLLGVDYTQPNAFKHRARQLQQQLWQDLEHSMFSGVAVMREMMIQTKEQVTMPVIFTSLLANPQLQERAAADTNWLGTLVYAVSQTPQVWLDNQVYEENGELVYNWDTVEDLFPAGMIDAMFATYGRLLEDLVVNAEVWQTWHPLYLPQAQQTLQQQLNQTHASFPALLLQEGFFQQAQRQPQHPAVVTPELTLTYAELSQRAYQVAHRLQRLGVEPNQLVAISIEKGWEQVVAVYGILAAGAAYVPIDPSLPPERRMVLLEQSQVKWVLSQRRLSPTIAWPQAQMIAVDSEDLRQEDDTPLPSKQQPTDLAYVIYTSGSTGLPKGVMIDHQGAMNTIQDINQRFNVGPQDRVFALSSLSFDLSVYDIFGTLAAGGTLVIPPANAAKDPAVWSQVLQCEQVTIWNSVPALMQMLVTYAANRPNIVPRSLRLALLSGDWLPLSLPDQIQDLVPKTQVVSLGGATEASIWSIFYPIKEIDPTWTSIPYGRPLANQQFYVLDEHLENCPVWVPGQLYIGGAGLAKGYWCDEAKTTASFITHPRTGKVLYRTGDLGRYRPEGEIEFLGREDTQVKVGGYRIELGEIEAALEQHPQVAQAVVLTTGETTQGQQLVANVCLESDVTPDPSNAETLPVISAICHEPAQQPERWQTALSTAMSQAAQVSESADWQSFKRFWQYMQELYQVSVGRALHQLGLFTKPGDRFTLKELQQRSKIHPRYRHWLKRALDHLVQQDYLHQQGADYIQRLPLPETIPSELIQNLIAEVNQTVNLSNTSATNLLVKTVDSLADILTENQHSAELYADEAVPEVYEKQFHTSNLVMQHAIAALVESWKPEGTLRILEVGAGIGSTTNYVLPLLPAERTQYVFTDISPYFMQLAQQNFADYPFLETKLFNLEQSPQIQNYELHSFDLVIASSVLHTTRDIAETLTHIVSLLKPGGALLLLEETQFHAPFDLSMGLQQGFDRFEDTALRQGHPLLSQEQWQQALLSAGFTECQVLSQSDTVAQWIGFDVFLVRGPATVRSFQPDNLNLYLEQKLPAYMVPQSYLSLETIPLTANGKVDRRTLQALWPTTSAVKTAYIAPHNAIQQRVTDIWQDLLDRDRIGIKDNFFELGGDSLVATQVMARVQESFQIEVSLRHLFEGPTVANLADVIVQTLAAQIDPDLLSSLEADVESETAEVHSVVGDMV